MYLPTRRWASSPAAGSPPTSGVAGAGATMGGRWRWILRRNFTRTMRRLKNFAGVMSSSSVVSSPQRSKDSGSAATRLGMTSVVSVGRLSRPVMRERWAARRFAAGFCSAASGSASPGAAAPGKASGFPGISLKSSSSWAGSIFSPLLPKRRRMRWSSLASRRAIFALAASSSAPWRAHFSSSVSMRGAKQKPRQLLGLQYFGGGFSVPFIPRSHLSAAQVDAVEQELQGFGRERHGGGSGLGCGGPGEGSLFQTLGQHADAGAVVVEDLEAVAAFVGEDEERTALQPPDYDGRGDGGEAVEGLAHVVVFEGEVDAHAGREADHRDTTFPARSVSMRLAARASWLASVMMSRTPQPNSTRIWRSEGWRISISTKVTSATRHGLGTDEEDIPRDYGGGSRLREISRGAAFPLLTQGRRGPCKSKGRFS